MLDHIFASCLFRPLPWSLGQLISLSILLPSIPPHSPTAPSSSWATVSIVPHVTPSFLPLRPLYETAHPKAMSLGAPGSVPILQEEYPLPAENSLTTAAAAIGVHPTQGVTPPPQLGTRYKPMKETARCTPIWLPYMHIQACSTYVGEQQEGLTE